MNSISNIFFKIPIMKIQYFFTILILSFLFFSCSTTSEDEDLDQTDPPADNITYKAHIAPIMSSKCNSCHKNPPINNAPMPLITYENVKDAVMNKGLIGQVDSGAMPPAGSDLTDTQVKQIKDWKAGGYKEK